MVPREEPTPFDDIALMLDADLGHLPVIRALAADLGRHVGFGAEDVADFRVAVDEACSFLIVHAQAGAMLSCLFRVLDAEVRVTDEAGSDDAPEADTGSQLLRLLADCAMTTSATEPDGRSRLIIDLIKGKAD